MQNDQIKEEIINDEEGIPLIARCVYQENCDFMTIQQTALRIIDGISFRSNLAVEQIKENDLLMEYIRELAKKTERKFTPEVNRILWKVEEEDLIQKRDIRKKQPSTNKKTFDEKTAVYQYVRGDHRFRLNGQESRETFDVMISYYHDDRDLVKRLYQRLIESNSYRISFVEDNRYTWDPKAMAEAIEQSVIILMCFSNQYRNSYACRLEAEYAKKRKRSIIPVKLTEYDPTGWVKEIIGKKTPIDFLRESNKEYEQIVEQINKEYQKINKN